MFLLSQPWKISVSISRGRSLALLALAGFACATILSVASFAQSNPPLSFGNNYFVTGDYVVAGAQGLNASFGSDGLGTGTISFPDGNPGIRGTTTVPKGANIVAALLYWQTVEKVGVTPGQPGSGQNGFFGPIFNKVPRLYPISGLRLPSHNNTSFSNGGCSGTSTGKVVETYRTDVRGLLPLDANGNVLVDSADGVNFEVRLPNVGNNTPLTLGATLVLIYRVISPKFPLNVITIYDGAFAPNTTPNFAMSQPVQGFYQAASSPVSRLTHIVGAGKSNKFQQAYLGGGQGGSQRVPTALPSPYGIGQPAFPGFYGNWDNTTWVFPDPNFPNFPNLANPLQENDDSATAMVVASGANPGCASWGAVIVSTTVRDDDKDGILQVWKQNQGYTDVGTGELVSLADANDPPESGQKDVFIQLDHVAADSNGDFATDASAAASTVKAAFLANNHNIHLHITFGNTPISEPACTDASIAPQLCPYPNQPGVTTWRDGFEFVKSQPVNFNYTEAQCEANSPPLVPIGPLNCVRRFPPAQRNSHHYVVWGDTLGAPNWTFLGGRLTDSTRGGTGAGMVVQTGSTITFYTTRGHGLIVDPKLGNGRVTIANAITNPSLNGTYLVQSVQCMVNPDTNPPTGKGDCSVSNRALGPYSFTITIGNARMAKYTLQTDPYLAVASGQAGSGSGFSDVGGDGTLITLGQWGTNATPQAKAGTLMHELGHTLGLLHGGGDSTNCKSNYQSVMNYMFQAHLLGPNGVLDLSSQQLSMLDEANLGPITTTDESNIAFPSTKWYDTKQTFAFVNGKLTAVGNAASQHCDGTSLSINDPTTYKYAGGTMPLGILGELDIPWSTTSSFLDINFEGGKPGSEPKFLGYNDWANVDLRQVGAGGNEYFSVPGGFIPGGPGGFIPGGPGGFIPGGPGGFIPGGPGGFIPGGPGGFIPGGPGISGGGGSVELDFANATSTIDPPTNLTASEGASPRTITLTWNSLTFPQVEKYNIYRSSDNGVTFSFRTSVTPVSGTVQTFPDTVTCNPAGYKYFVTAVFLNTALNKEQESAASNTAPSSGPKLTGCYTNTQGTVALTDLSFPANPNVQGSLIPITLSLQVDNPSAYPNPFVNNLFANTLVAIGPLQPLVGGACPTSVPAGPVITLLSNGIVNPTYSTSTYGVSAGPNYQFTFKLDTDVLSSGCYFLKLTTDSGQSETTASALQLRIDVSDTDDPQIVTTSLPNGVVGLAYNTAINQHGGTAPFSWAFTGSLPPGILANSAGTLSGTTCAAGTYPLMVTVTDKLNNFGSQGLTLRINQASTTTGVVSSANPSVVGQTVTFTATVAPQSPCSPTGTVTLFDGGNPIASNLPLSGSGMATFTTSALSFGIHAITVTYSGDANFTGSTSAILYQTVKAYTTTSLTSSANPSMFAQPTFTATVAPVAPGVGAPTGSVTFFDGTTTQIGSASLASGMAAFTPSNLSVGVHTITATYGGDTNFVGSVSGPISQQINAVVTNNNDSGTGSLRQAIADVNNAQSSPQTIGIVFNISGNGVQTIAPPTDLPTLTQPAILDATTQAGYAGTPIIELNGSAPNSTAVNGLHITAGNSTVRGFAINGFSGDGILIDTNGGNVIQGNYIGTNVAGATAQPNGGNGIQIIATPNNVVGGTASSMRNLISGNGGEGVRIDGTLATGNIVQGNYIGTDASGSAAVGNILSGIYIRRAPGNSVIGNIVSGNQGFAGITICGNTTGCGGGDPAGIDEASNAAGNVVQGNFVGTNSAGTAALGNNGAGVSIDGAPNTLVGGTTSAMYNVISFNGTNDVQIFDPGAGGNQIQGNTIQGSTTATTVGISVDASLIGNTLSQNSISGHGGLGIVGPSNYPVIATATFDSGSGMTTITGNLNSTANAKFTIEFFSSLSGNASGFGEGAVFLGSVSVTTDGSGYAALNFSVAGPVATNTITATSTDANGTTSEFSAWVPVS
jgi:hypothetical protein